MAERVPLSEGERSEQRGRDGAPPPSLISRRAPTHFTTRRRVGALRFQCGNWPRKPSDPWAKLGTAAARHPYLAARSACSPRGARAPAIRSPHAWRNHSEANGHRAFQPGIGERSEGASR